MRSLALSWCVLPLWIVSCAKAPPPPARMDLTARTPPATLPWAPPSALKEAWRVELNDGLRTEPLIVNNNVVIRSEHGTYLLDGRTGARRPTLIAPDGSVRQAPPDAAPAHILVLENLSREYGSPAGQFSAFDSDTGHRLWEFAPDQKGQFCKTIAVQQRGLPLELTDVEWNCQNRGCSRSANAPPSTIIVSVCLSRWMELIDKTRYVVGRVLHLAELYWDYKVTSLDPFTGNVRWEVDVGRRPDSRGCGDFRQEALIFADARYLYVLGPGDDNELNVYDLEDGRFLWRRQFESSDHYADYVEIYPAGDLVWAKETGRNPMLYVAATGEPAKLSPYETRSRYETAFLPTINYSVPYFANLPLRTEASADEQWEVLAITRDALFVRHGMRRVEILDPVKGDLLTALWHDAGKYKKERYPDGSLMSERPLGIYTGALASGEPIVMTVYADTLIAWRRSLP